jgi:transposase
MQVPVTFVGVDVSKDRLDVAAAHGGQHIAVFNTPGAIDAWLATLPAGACVAVESTGAYHQLLVQRCQHRAVAVYVLNAKDVYFYAKGLGARAKTDRLDALVIARYLAEHHCRLRPCAPVGPALTELDRLLRQRAVLVAKRVSLRQAFKDCSVKQALHDLEQGFGAAEQALQQRIQQLIDSDRDLQHGQTLLRSITGFGATASALLAVLLTRLSFANSDALVAYSGLDPRANDSGSKRGRRRLSKKGDPELRRTIWLVAFAACHSKALKPHYQALRARGFQSTEALVILGRKLLRAAFAVWKTQQPFDPQLLRMPAAT